MKTVTYEEFIKFEPCWLDNEKQAEQLKAYSDAKPNMSALDMLALDDVSIEDRFWAVLREELIPADILHEFGCLCAEHALSKIENPDPRSVEAVVAKRKWMKGEIPDEELEAARDAAHRAWVVAWEVASTVARWAAWGAVRNVARDAASAAAWGAACDEERAWQVETLIKLLEKGDNR